MGSGQSTTAGKPDQPVMASLSSTESMDGKLSDTIKVGKTNTGKKRNKDSVDYQCRKQKRAWSRCVSNHYEKKFLPGKSLEPEEDCDDFFDSFRDCYMRGMLKQRKEKGMAPPAKDSMLYEFMEEEGMVEDNGK